jgi:hypothetical protein
MTSARRTKEPVIVNQLTGWTSSVYYAPHRILTNGRRTNTPKAIIC